MRIVDSRVHRPDQVISLGVDVGGSRIAWSVASQRALLDVQHFEVAGRKSRSAALHECSQVLIEGIRGYEITEVHIEEPYIGRGTRSSLQLAQMAGAVLAAFGAHTTLTPELVPVATWKKQVCGRGDLTKEGVTRWLDRNHPEWLDECRYTSPKGLARINQDRVDCICIGRMAFIGPDHGLERRAVRRGRGPRQLRADVPAVA